MPAGPGPQSHRRLSIPAPDRHLFGWREWDRYHIMALDEPQPYGSITYINPQKERLYLYRNLVRPGNCNPSTYDYEQAHEAAMPEMLVYKGDLVFPDEKAAKDAWEEWARVERERRRQQAEAEAERERLRKLAPIRNQQPGPSYYIPRRPINSASLTAPPPPARAVQSPSEELVCTTCGKATHDWWTRYGPGEGECRACLFKKQGIQPKFCNKCGSAFPLNSMLRGGLCPECR